MTPLFWEPITTQGMSFVGERTAVPGGWLVVARNSEGGGIASVFVADPAHEWGYGERELQARKALKDAEMARAYEEVVSPVPSYDSEVVDSIF